MEIGRERRPAKARNRRLGTATTMQTAGTNHGTPKASFEKASAKNCPSIRGEIPVAQAWRHAFRTRSRVVLQLVAQMLRIGGIISAFGIRIRQQRMSRQGLDSKRVGWVEIE